MTGHRGPAVLAPPASIAVIGGGQLGRMFVQAAQRLGYRAGVLGTIEDGPAAQVAQWTDAHRRRLADPQLDRARVRRVVENRLAILKALSDGGVRLLMGTDAPQQFSVPGFSLHRELRRMRDAGLTPEQVLVTGTRNVGAYFRTADRFGTVAPGQRADLLLLDADPRADLANLTRRSGVMLRGRWLPEPEIQRRLEAIAARNQR